MPLFRILTSTVLCLLAAAFPLKLVSADPADPQVPPGFRLVSAATGASLYQKDYKNGNPDFVQVVDLSQGAGVEVLHGKVADPGAGKGAFGGNDASLHFSSLEQFWAVLSAAHSTAFCITNGQFFYMKENPTRLPFPLKKDGQLITDGYEIKNFPDQKLMLEIWPNRVDIRELTRETLYTSTAADVVAGLTEEANKKAKFSVGRTFVGVDDRDLDGWFETLLVFNTLSARQKDAARVLKSFGADKVMMLDGGGSTQLICQGKDYIESERLIPQALGILAGPPLTPPAATEPPPTSSPPVLTAAIAAFPEWPVFIEGETIQLDVEIQNTGTLTWNLGETQLVVEKASWGEVEKHPIEGDLQPGDYLRLAWTAGPLSGPGVYTGQLYLERGGEKFPADPINFHLVALPQELEGRRGDLEREISLWSDQRLENIDQRVEEWIQEQAAPIQPINFFSVVWIPLAILPLAILLAYSITKNRE